MKINIVLLISILKGHLVVLLLFVICKYIDGNADRSNDSSIDVNVTKQIIDNFDSYIDSSTDGTDDSYIVIAIHNDITHSSDTIDRTIDRHLAVVVQESIVVKYDYTCS